MSEHEDKCGDPMCRSCWPEGVESMLEHGRPPVVQGDTAFIPMKSVPLNCINGKGCQLEQLKTQLAQTEGLLKDETRRRVEAERWVNRLLSDVKRLEKASLGGRREGT